jgi:hypothetical protein
MAELERFVHHLQMLHQAEIHGELVGALGEVLQNIEDSAVPKAGVGLPAYREESVETELLAHLPVQILNLAVISPEQLEEAVLGARSSLGSPDAVAGQQVLQILPIDHQLLQPEQGTLSERGRLSRLKVGVAQTAQALVLFGETGQFPDHPQQPAAQDRQSLVVLNQLGVVRNEAAGCTQVNDAFGLGALLPVGVNAGHHIVTELPLQAGHGLEVDIIPLGPQLGQLLAIDAQTKLGLAFRQCDPQPPPGTEFVRVGEDRTHFAAGVPLYQRIRIAPLVFLHAHAPF